MPTPAARRPNRPRRRCGAGTRRQHAARGPRAASTASGIRRQIGHLHRHVRRLGAARAGHGQEHRRLQHQRRRGTRASRGRRGAPRGREPEQRARSPAPTTRHRAGRRAPPARAGHTRATRACRDRCIAATIATGPRRAAPSTQRAPASAGRDSHTATPRPWPAPAGQSTRPHQERGRACTRRPAPSVRMVGQACHSHDGPPSRHDEHLGRDLRQITRLQEAAQAVDARHEQDEQHRRQGQRQTPAQARPAPGAR